MKAIIPSNGLTVDEVMKAVNDNGYSCASYFRHIQVNENEHLVADIDVMYHNLIIYSVHPMVMSKLVTMFEG